MFKAITILVILEASTIRRDISWIQALDSKAINTKAFRLKVSKLLSNNNKSNLSNNNPNPSSANNKYLNKDSRGYLSTKKYS